MVPVLRALAQAALRGQMTPKELQTFGLLVAGGLFTGVRMLRASTSGIGGLLKSLVIVLAAHASRRAAHKALCALFPETFRTLGLPEDVSTPRNADAELEHVSTNYALEHSVSLRLLKSCLELAIILNIRGMSWFDVRWSLTLRDVDAVPPSMPAPHTTSDPVTIPQTAEAQHSNAAVILKALPPHFETLDSLDVSSSGGGQRVPIADVSAVSSTSDRMFWPADLKAILSSRSPMSPRHGNTSYQSMKWASPVRPGLTVSAVESPSASRRVLDENTL